MMREMNDVRRTASKLNRREFLAFTVVEWLWPPNWFRGVGMAGAGFERISNGTDRRRYIWIHGDEKTAGEALRAHMEGRDGRAFLIRNDERHVSFQGGLLDPNRMFSREGAERNLVALNASWSPEKVRNAAEDLDDDRPGFLKRILPAAGGLLVAVHNNGPDYSVKDEVPISDQVSLRNPDAPDEFLLCTYRPDFQILAGGPFNVVLQSDPPPPDDGSLSRLCARRNVRYVNVEAAHGNGTGQRRMLEWVEGVLV
jgi:hypothetical protein